MEAEKRIGRHRLSMDIPDELYKTLRLMCIKRNCTMTKYVIRALLEKIQWENKYD